MKSFIHICRMARSQRYGRFLTYLLVKKALEVKIADPSTLAEHLIVEFEHHRATNETEI